MGKVLSREALVAAIADERAHGRTVAFANGCFDLLHVGHARYLQGAAALADVLALHSPIEQFREHFLVPPIWQEGGDWAFPLGTDDVGRDMLSRLIHGARLSLIIGFSVAALALATAPTACPTAV